ncbi:hypothetical protein [Chitinimonas sp. JJ19]|uniref:hypothetical protein n=1 Tax=Chitinimonas sp. JJ19 TaxID=3109352 RepID=UPI0030038C64
MTPQQIVGLGVRLFSIWLVISGVPYLSTIPVALASQELSQEIISALLIGFFHLIFAALIWLFPMVVAHSLIPKTEFENCLKIRPDEMASVGVCLMGLWGISLAAPDLLSYLFQVYLNSGGESIWAALDARGRADVFFIVVELAIGLGLFFNAAKIARFITHKFDRSDS